MSRSINVALPMDIVVGFSQLMTLKRFCSSGLSRTVHSQNFSDYRTIV
jgi:hypothetical protein